MITKIHGKLLQIGLDDLILEMGNMEYQVFIPEFVRGQLQSKVGEQISLHTIHYIEGNPAQGSRLSPKLIGFSSQTEREFFDLFCSVDGVGAKKALRAMIRPVRDVATAIEEQDVKGLSALPGIGPATAERIIAKLRRKVPKFALMISEKMPDRSNVKPDIIEETFNVLRSLGHSEVDAKRMVEGALESKKKYKDVESLIQAVYQFSHSH